MNVFTNPVASLSLTESIEIDTSQNEIQHGDVFFTTSSETPEEVGMSSVWLGDESNVYLNSFCFGYRLSRKIDYYYLAFYLRSVRFRNNMSLLAQGISRYNISKNKVMEIDVTLPDVNEQRIIGRYFRTLDNLITLHQRAHLTIYYKGVVKWLIKLEKPTYLLIIILNGLKFIKKALLEKLRCQNIE